MKRMTFETHGPEEVNAVAEKILSACSGCKIFAIYGDLGAGKTVLVKAMCLLLGTADVVKSPTFAIVNDYDSPSGQIHHFDFYRIDDPEEAYDLGFDEYFDSGEYCFVEWPERIEMLLPEETIRIHIEVTGPNDRKIELALER